MAIKRSFILSSGIGVSADNLFVVNNTNSITTQIAKLSTIANADPAASDAIEAYYKQIQPIALQMRRAR
jgi:hypothetical protein